MGFWRGEAFHAALDDEAVDAAFFVFGPNNGHIAEGGVGDPHFGAVEQVMVAHILKVGDHATGVGAKVGFGQTEAAQPFAARQFGQVLLTLLLIAVGVNGVHDQGRLHRTGRTHAAVTALNLLHHQAVADLVQTGTAVLRRDIGTKSANFRQTFYNLGGEGRLLGVVFNNGADIPLYPVARGIANELVLFREEFVQEVVIGGFEKVRSHSKKVVAAKVRQSAFCFV